MNRRPEMLKAFGRVEGFKHDLERLESTLAAAPLWLPGASLKMQCDQAVHMIDGIAERFDRKLVVTLIGPSGSGKSTLLNALAGVDDFSQVGHQRPTTGSLLVFGDETEDARLLAENLDGDCVEIRSSAAAVFPEHVILIDSPDTDSTANAKHIPVLRRAIAHSDMLICVFDAENPKRRDHVDFLAPFVQRFHGESLVGVINKCDRLDESELQGHILPDFDRYIQAAWNQPVDRVLCISARNHLHDPKWDDTAVPKHEFDQFEELRDLVFDTINSAGYIIDRRLDNARSLREYVYQEAGREVLSDKDALDSARRQLGEAERTALMTAATAMIDDDSRQVVGVNVMVYQKLSQMWLGPVGWMVAIWARLLVFGTGIVSMFRFGRPLQQMLGMISAFRHFKDSRSAAADSYNAQRVDAALRNYRLAIMKSWPDIAAAMVQARFDSSVRRINDALDGSEDFGDNMSAIWSQTLDQEIERVTRKLSGFMLQLIFNAPGVAILGYTGWLTLQGFLTGQYLSGGFFLHAFWVIAIVLLFSFFVLQMFIRLIASARRISARALEKLNNQIDQVEGVMMNPVRTQLETVLDLVDRLEFDAPKK
jgi:energy-coupling factor transporter ATP-binding protein EcfA2